MEHAHLLPGWVRLHHHAGVQPQRLQPVRGCHRYGICNEHLLWRHAQLVSTRLRPLVPVARGRVPRRSEFSPARPPHEPACTGTLQTQPLEQPSPSGRRSPARRAKRPPSSPPPPGSAGAAQPPAAPPEPARPGRQAHGASARTPCRASQAGARGGSTLAALHWANSVTQQQHDSSLLTLSVWSAGVSVSVSVSVSVTGTDGQGWNRVMAPMAGVEPVPGLGHRSHPRSSVCDLRAPP
jgi:hypothetical protein